MDETQTERQRTSPTVRRHMLAAELKELRRAAGLTHVDVADRLGWPQAKVSKIEGSRQAVGVEAVIALADICHAEGRHREHLVSLAHQARGRGWWDSYRDVLPPEDRLYIGFEAEAADVRVFGTEVLPELVRTRDYAAAVLAARRSAEPAADSERSLEALEIRQRNLDSGGVPLDLVLAESALRRVVGGPDVLRGQWDRLLEIAARAEVTLRVLPFAAGALAADGPFTVLSFGADSPPAVVYRPALAVRPLLDSPTDVQVHQDAFDQLVESALDPEESVRLLEKEVDRAKA
ncbi:helix-turn-helix domain-containing protein [Saccharopolyspora sp. HNM0986]|uniref:helix-turn-helix domain-containing protein n=1 Tax=Saccharopolyspora galaxeae TaxID=2781241 RepID=UPI00190CBF29|nr:helix-turn-helix transcriptional regulator [Saccharopolyspora sp. HNM0986]MBK0870328.1 helix-turn-helix domain-containing protein [Saccharopolyspora sp. HNM0986]